jgi:hypothetical protein
VRCATARKPVAALVLHIGEFCKSDVFCDGWLLLLDLGLWLHLLLHHWFRLGRLSLLDLLAHQLGDELGKHHVNGWC